MEVCLQGRVIIKKKKTIHDLKLPVVLKGLQVSE